FCCAKSDGPHTTGLRIPARNDASCDLREALSPYRILDHDRHDVPAVIEAVDPQLVVRQLEKVGKQEHEAPTGHRAPVRFQMLEDARQEVRLGGERTVESELRQRPLRARWTPQRFLFGEIEVAEK